jgi:hypothetical protein
MAISTSTAGTFEREGRLSIRRATAHGDAPAKAPSMISIEELRAIHHWLTDMTPNAGGFKSEHAKLVKAVEVLGLAIKASVVEEKAPF